MKDNKLRVRDLVANIEYKGKVTEEQIIDMYGGEYCKSNYKLGTGDCGGQDCEDCFNTLMSDLEMRDNDAYDYDHEYDDEEDYNDED